MHPLEGPRLRIWRANEHIKTLRDADESFRKEADYRVVVAELNDDGSEYALRALVNVLPPQELGLCIGETAHNLRAALDGLVYQLGRLNGASEVALTRTQFPIFLNAAAPGCVGSCPTGKRYHFNCRGKQMIGPLHKIHKAALKRLQPYQPGNLGAGSPLYFLDELNNADKHRLLQVVGGKPMGYMVGMGSGDQQMPDYHIRPRIVLEDGAKVGSVSVGFLPRVQMNQTIIPYIAFWHGCDVVRGRGVAQVLSQIATHASDIIESFAQTFS